MASACSVSASRSSGAGPVVELLRERAHRPAAQVAVTGRQGGQRAAQRGHVGLVHDAHRPGLPQRADGRLHRRLGGALDVTRPLGDLDRLVDGLRQAGPVRHPPAGGDERQQQVVAVGPRRRRVLRLRAEGVAEQVAGLLVRVQHHRGAGGVRSRAPGPSRVRRAGGEPVARGLRPRRLGVDGGVQHLAGAGVQPGAARQRHGGEHGVADQGVREVEAVDAVLDHQPGDEGGLEGVEDVALAVPADRDQQVEGEGPPEDRRCRSAAVVPASIPARRRRRTSATAGGGSAASAALGSSAPASSRAYSTRKNGLPSVRRLSASASRSDGRSPTTASTSAAVSGAGEPLQLQRRAWARASDSAASARRPVGAGWERQVATTSSRAGEAVSSRWRRTRRDDGSDQCRSSRTTTSVRVRAASTTAHRTASQVENPSDGSTRCERRSGAPSSPSSTDVHGHSGGAPSSWEQRPDPHLGAARTSEPDELGAQARLADAGLADEHRGLRRALLGPLEQADELLERRGPARPAATGEATAAGRRGGRGCRQQRGVLAQDRGLERAQLGARGRGPSSSASSRRTSRSAASASAWRPARVSASTRSTQSRSRSGCSVSAARGRPRRRRRRPRRAGRAPAARRPSPCSSSRRARSATTPGRVAELGVRHPAPQAGGLVEQRPRLRQRHVAGGAVGSWTSGASSALAADTACSARTASSASPGSRSA
jgi:hypothetical protein